MTSYRSFRVLAYGGHSTAHNILLSRDKVLGAQQRDLPILLAENEGVAMGCATVWLSAVPRLVRKDEERSSESCAAILYAYTIKCVIALVLSPQQIDVVSLLLIY